MKIETLTTTMLQAKFELDSLARLRNSAVKAGNLRKYDAYTQSMREKLAAYMENIRLSKRTVVENLVIERTSQITAVQFQQLVDTIPFYGFRDLQTGLRYEQIAYGTECNRRRNQLLVSVATTAKNEANTSLAWVDQALRNWTKTFIKLQPSRAVGFEISSQAQVVA